MKGWVRDTLTIIGFGWTLQIALELLGLDDDPWAFFPVVTILMLTFAFMLWMGMFDPKERDDA